MLPVRYKYCVLIPPRKASKYVQKSPRQCRTVSFLFHQVTFCKKCSDIMSVCLWWVTEWSQCCICVFSSSSLPTALWLHCSASRTFVGSLASGLCVCNVGWIPHFLINKKKKNYWDSKSMEMLDVTMSPLDLLGGELSESVWEKTWYDVFYPCSSWIVKGVFIFLILSHSAPQACFYCAVSLCLVESCCLNSCSYSSNNKAVCLQSVCLPLYPLCYLQETAELSKPFRSAWRMGST